MILLVNNRRTENDNPISNIISMKRYFSYLQIPYYEVRSIEILPADVRSKIKGIILSGSELKLTDSLLFSDYVHNFYYMNMFPSTPVLGICFGCQLLAMIHGYDLHYLGKRIRNSSQMVQLTNHFLFSDIYSSEMSTYPFRVNFSGLIQNAKTQNSPHVKEIAFLFIGNTQYPCAFEFSPYRFGMMIHPEYNKRTYPVLCAFMKHTKCDIGRISKQIQKRSSRYLSKKTKIERKNKTVRRKKE
jgi:GMP synthase-like glutamine amidotransferase